ncbi:MAG TPA: hypothetical protein VJ508_12600 [Saprospiraceae bacterium]|nr:hypothetical protein [Saprospiraceae bacterium]
MLKSLIYYFPTGANLIAILVAVYFIISDKMKYEYNHDTYLILATLAMIAWVGVSWWLKNKGNLAVAAIMAWIPAVPLILYGIMILLFMILQPDMK